MATGYFFRQAYDLSVVAGFQTSKLGKSSLIWGMDINSDESDYGLRCFVAHEQQF